MLHSCIMYYLNCYMCPGPDGQIHSKTGVVFPTFSLINRPTGVQETWQEITVMPNLFMFVIITALCHTKRDWKLEFLLTKWFDKPLLLPASRFMCLSLPICLSASLGTHTATGLYYQKTRQPCRYRVNKITYYDSNRESTPKRLRKSASIKPFFVLLST